MLSLSAARWLLVLHTGLGVAAVAAGTHLVIWLRRYLRGTRSRRAVVKFAAIFVALQVAAFVAGNVMYPTYKVEVRAAYLENPRALAADHPASATEELVRSAAQAARWFDVKEHWVALGLVVAAALVLMLTVWDPKRDGPALGRITFGLALVACVTLWLAAVIGVVTTSWKAV